MHTNVHMHTLAQTHTLSWLMSESLCRNTLSKRELSERKRWRLATMTFGYTRSSRMDSWTAVRERLSGGEKEGREDRMASACQTQVVVSATR